MGKVDLCRVDTCLIYANLTRRLWTMVDGELFIARRWFSDEYHKKDPSVDLIAAHERQVEELYAEIGRLTTHVAWLNNTFSKINSRVPRSFT